MMFFMFPETRYTRLSSSSSGGSSINSRNDRDDNVVTQTTQSKTITGAAAAEKSEAPTLSSSPSNDHITLAASTHHRPIGRPSCAQFSLIPKLQFEGREILFRDIIAPIQIFTFPIICWVAFAFGFATNCLLALNLTQSQVFAAPPYLFNPAQVGFVNFAFVVGGVIGLLTAGPFSDWVSMRATIRNKGVREAEMRLIALVPYIAICLVGMVVTAVGYQRKWPWEAIVIIGYGFVGVECIAIPAIVISVCLWISSKGKVWRLANSEKYAVDCYKHLPGQIMVCATIVKNTWGVSYFYFFVPPLHFASTL